MRQGQQNRRGRGRNHNHHQQRKGQNPLTRSYESNGPEVKLRGTANHIAEKYLSLARDALSSGDPVLAENYLQHAEHYNRIIMAFREQNASNGGGDQSLGGSGDYGEQSSTTETGLGSLDAEGSEESLEEASGLRAGSGDQETGQFSGSSQFETQGSRSRSEHFRPHNQSQGHREKNFSEGRGDFHDRRDRRDRHEGRDRNERRDRPDNRFDRRDRDRRDRFDRYQAHNASGEQRGEFSQSSPRPDRNGGDRLSHDIQEQPEFLRRSVRRTRQVEEATPEAASTDVPRGKEGGNRE